MINLTQSIPAWLLERIRNITECKQVLILGFSTDYHAEIIRAWIQLREKNPAWTCRAIDQEVASRFGISSRTVQRIRLNWHKLAQQQVDK